MILLFVRAFWHTLTQGLRGGVGYRYSSAKGVMQVKSMHLQALKKEKAFWCRSSWVNISIWDAGVGVQD